LGKRSRFLGKNGVVSGPKSGGGRKIRKSNKNGGKEGGGLKKPAKPQRNDPGKKKNQKKKKRTQNNPKKKKTHKKKKKKKRKQKKKKKTQKKKKKPQKKKKRHCTKITEGGVFLGGGVEVNTKELMVGGSVAPHEASRKNQLSEGNDNRLHGGGKSGRQLREKGKKSLRFVHKKEQGSGSAVLKIECFGCDRGRKKKKE